MRLSAPLLHRVQALAVASSAGPTSLQWTSRGAAVASGGRAAMDYRAYGFLIQHCADHGLLRAGQQLHARLLLFSIVPSNFLASKLVSLYSRCDRLEDARRVFDDIPHRNLFSWNAMVIAYALHGHPYDAFRLFSSLHQELPPDAFTISALLKSFSSLLPSDVPRSAQSSVHAIAVRCGLDDHIVVCNGLITLYANVNDLVSARKLFDVMPERDIISWNSMVSGYSQNGQYAECLCLYQEMERSFDGMIPNGVTMVSVFQACSHLRNLSFGARVHRFAVQNGIEMDNAVWNSIICFYAKCGSLNYARVLFEEMPDKDGVTYSAMITGYMSYGLVSTAMELFPRAPNPTLSAWNSLIAGLVQNNRQDGVLEVMYGMQTQGFRPNSVTLSSALPALSRVSNLSGGKQVHAYAIRNDYDQNIFMVAALIDMYAKAGFLGGAKAVFEMTKARSVIVWTAIITAYTAHGNVDSALGLFSEMLECGTKPDLVTFTVLLSACAHAGMVNEARYIFETLLPRHGIYRELEHYTCMVGVLSRSGMLKEALKFIEDMPFEPNAKAWGAVLDGAMVYGDLDAGRHAIDELFEIEPENTGNYILMANLLSKAGKLEEAKILRDKMKMAGLTKIPGCSW